MHNHARTGEALLQLKTTTCSLRDYLFKEIAKKQTSPAKKYADIEHSKRACLIRLSILCMRCDLTDLLEDCANDDEDDTEMKHLCNAIADNVHRELLARQVQTADAQEPEPMLPEIWFHKEKKLHVYVADSIMQSFDFLMAATAHRLNKELKKLASDDSDELEVDLTSHFLVRLHKRLLELITLCLNQHVTPEEECSPERRRFVATVEMHALRLRGDLLLLFPDSWVDASSPLLRALAFKGHDAIRGGIIQFFNSKEPKVRIGYRYCLYFFYNITHSQPVQTHSFICCCVFSLSQTRLRGQTTANSQI
jgi:hypothetical protein